MWTKLFESWREWVDQVSVSQTQRIARRGRQRRLQDADARRGSQVEALETRDLLTFQMGYLAGAGLMDYQSDGIVDGVGPTTLRRDATISYEQAVRLEFSGTSLPSGAAIESGALSFSVYTSGSNDPAVTELRVQVFGTPGDGAVTTNDPVGGALLGEVVVPEGLYQPSGLQNHRFTVPLNPAGLQALLTNGIAGLTLRLADIHAGAADVIEIVPNSFYGSAFSPQLEVEATTTSPVSLALSTATANEGDVVTATVTRTGDLSQPQTLQVHVSDPNRASYPATVTIPIGEATASFMIGFPNNNWQDGTSSFAVTVTGSEAGVAATSSLTLQDGAARLEVSSRLVGQYSNPGYAKLTLKEAISGSIPETFYLTTSTSNISVQTALTFVPGQRWAYFPFGAAMSVTEPTQGTLRVTNGAGALLASEVIDLAPESAIQNATLSLLPGTVASYAFDYDVDGIFDATSGINGSISVAKFPYGEARGIVEFGSASFSNPQEIAAASFNFLVYSNMGTPNGSPYPVQIYGYAADGVISVEDATQTSVLLGTALMSGESSNPSSYGAVQLDPAALRTLLQSSPTIGLLALLPGGTESYFAFDSSSSQLMVARDLPLTISDVSAVVVENSMNGTGVTTLYPSNQNGPVSFSITNGNSNGAFSIDASMGVVSVANAAALDFETQSSYSLEVTATDGTATDTATVTIAVLNVNEQPVPSTQSYVTNEDSTLTAMLAAVDPEGTALTFQLVSQPSVGVVTLLNSNGSFSYAPPANFNGSVSFGWRVSDGVTGWRNGTSTINVVAVNDAPSANAASFSGTEDTTLTGTLTGSDVEGSALSYSVAASPAKGTLTLNSNGTFSFVPNANANGVDTFSFRVNDGSLDSAPATVTINLAAVNDAPVANAATFNGTEDTALSGTLTGSDVEGTALSFSVMTTPANGSVTVSSNGNFTFTPTANFNGSTSFTYRVSDGLLFSTAATVTINLAAMNDAPVASNQTISLNEDTISTGTLAASDVDGGTLTYSLLSTPAVGTLTLNSNGAYSFTPPANFYGPTTFTFKVNDGLLDSGTATVTLNVVSVNDAPTANSATFNGTEDTTLTGTLTGSDVEGSALTYSVFSSPANGVLTLNSNGTFSFVPNANFNGSTSFMFRVRDGVLYSPATTVTLNLAAVNDAPMANAATFNGTEDTTLNGALSGSDVEGSALSYSVVSGPTNGALTLNSNGTFNFVPNGNFNGSDSFTFRVNDGSLNSTAATVALNIAAVNDAPVANAASFNGTEDTTLNGALTGSDVEGSALTYSVFSSPTNGSLTLNSNGTFSFVPNANFNGSTSFSFRVNDGALYSPATTVTLNIAAVNDAPVATEASFGGAEDATLNGSLSGSDLEGSVLSYALVSGPANGSVTINNDGTFSFVPSANFNGSDSFTFKVNDGSLDSAPATVTLKLIAINDAPVANSATFNGTEDITLNGTLTGSDVEGSTLSYSLVTTPAHGAMTLNSDGTFVFVPSANFNGATTFDFLVNDGSTNSSMVTVTLNIAAVNDAPVATPRSDSAFEDLPSSGTLQGFDVEGSPLSFSVVTGPANGTVTISGSTFTFVPNANFNGSDSFTFRVNDGELDSAPATVSISVAAVNDVPVATAATFNGTEDTMLNGVLSGFDVEGSPLSYSAGAAPANGTLTFNSDGTSSFLPDANFNGSTSFNFRVNDGTFNSSWATVTLNIAAVNDAPVANAASFNGTEDTTLNGSLSGSDVEGSALSYSVVTNPANGVLTLNSNGTFSFVPNANFNGSDSFSFRVNDGSLDSVAATVALNVAAVNDAPIANWAMFFATEDTPYVGSATGADVESPVLTFHIVETTHFGTLTFNTDGSFSYVPNANFNGLDGFVFYVNDGQTDSYPQANVFEVSAVDDAPIANTASFSGTEDTELNGTLSGSDVEGSALSYSVVTNPSNGALTLNADGTFSFVPNANFNGSDSFTFRVNDGSLNSTPATVTLNIAAVNDAPTANAASFNGTEDTTLNGTLSGSDVEGSALSYSVVSGPTNGTLTLNGDGTFSFVPNANFNGSDSFTFRVNDGSLNSTAATATLNVAAVNDAPVANGASFNGTEDATLNGALTGSDVEGSALSYSVVSDPASGSLTLNGNGTFSFTPNANFNGLDSFTFKVNDGSLDSAAATVTLNIAAVNDAPIANGASFNGTEDTTLNGALTGSDVEGSSLSFAVSVGPANGLLTLNSNGTFSFVPNANFNGSDSFTFSVNDGSLNSTDATVTLNTAAVNDAPVANAASFNGTEDVTRTGLLSGSDLEGSTLSYSVVTSPANGALTLNSNGTFSFVPNANFNGTDSFTFRVNDGSLDSAPATVSLNIAAVNDAPVANGATFNGAEDTTLNGALTGSDVEGSALSFEVVTSPANGSLTLNNDGTFSFVPNANFFGSTSFTFLVSDGALNSNAVTVSLNVAAVNDAPVANSATFNGTEDTFLYGTVSGSDVEGALLTYSVVTNPANGLIAFNWDGSFTFVPNANFNGSDSFTFRVSDGFLNSTAATVTLNMAAVNDAPTANAASFNGTEDTTLNGSLSGSDVEGSALSYSVVTSPANGALTLNSNGTFSFVPNANFNGTTSFTYRTNDSSLDSTAATVTFNIAAVNDAPVANGTTFSGTEDTTLNGTLSGSDVEGSGLSYAVVTSPANGSLTLNSNGTFSFLPNANFNGSDSFTFRVNDGSLNSTAATVTLNLAAVNDAPTISTATFSLPENSANGTTVGTVTSTDPDAGDTKTLNILSGNTNGAFAIANTGVITVANSAALDFETTPTFTLSVQATDGAGATSTANITINLTDVVEAAPTKFFTVDAGTDSAYRYAAAGTAQTASTLNAANINSVGVAADITGTKYWVIDSNKNVYVYNATTGALLGSWAASGLTTPQGITTDGTHVWIIDSGSDKVFKYDNAASRLSGSQAANSNWALNNGNKNSTDLVTNGTSIWTLESAASSDKVFKYSMTGTLQGSWTISATNATPTGLTIDPANVSDIWIVDSGTDRVYQYSAAASRTSGSQAFATSWALAAANTNPQGIADPPPPSTDSTATSLPPVVFATPVDDIVPTARRVHPLVAEAATAPNNDDEVVSVGTKVAEIAIKLEANDVELEATESANDAHLVSELFASERWLMHR